jgi:hypothetical protein
MTSTWQEIWTSSEKSPLGFGQPSTTIHETDLRAEIERRSLVPHELLSRFCRRLIVLGAE